jgi:hypothetical protein
MSYGHCSWTLSRARERAGLNAFVAQQGRPDSGPVHPANPGNVVTIPQISGLHHRYKRCAA